MDGPVVAAQANGAIKSPGAAPTSILDPLTIVDHLRNILKVNLGATDRDLEAPRSLLSDENIQDTIQRCTRFASETQVALYISQNQQDDKFVEIENGDGLFTLHLHFGSVLTRFSRTTSSVYLYTLLGDRTFARMHSMRGYHKTQQSP